MTQCVVIRFAFVVGRAFVTSRYAMNMLGCWLVVLLASEATLSTADRVWLPLLRIGFGAAATVGLIKKDCRESML